MSTERWGEVAKVDNVDAQPRAVSVHGVDLVVLRAPSGIKAYEGRCPHQGALLGEGERDGDALVCRNHRWRFDVETGKRQDGTQCLRACPVREIDGRVDVDVGAIEASAKVAAARRTLRDLPGPPSLPLLGSAHLLDPAAMHVQLEAWGRKYGTPYTYRFGPLRSIVLGEMDAMLPVLRARPETFRRSSNLAPVFRELGIDGVFSAEGKAWRPQRRLSMEALSHRHLRSFYPTLARTAERLRKRWLRAAERGDVLALCDELKRFTVDVTTELVFGHDANTIEQGDDVIQRKLELIFPALNRRLFSVVPWWRILRMPADRRVDRAVVELYEWIGGIVAKARERLEADPARAEHPANFLEAMLVARDDDDKPFDDETIFANALTMLLAGEDTTAYTLAWAVHHLADSPSDVSAFRGELDAALGESAVPESMEATNRLAYASAIANESMRLRPVAPLFFLEATEDTVVADVAIDKGTMIVLLMRAPATDASSFGDPAVFRPTRWLDKAATGGVHDAGALQPFGSGPRICPGRTLALLEMKVVLATLYKTFEVERVTPREDIRELLSFTMVPRSLDVRLTAR